MDKVVIKVEDVSKTFKLPHERQSSIKGLLTSFGKRNKTYELQMALNGISFEIINGEFFGIVGRNGSGKSTLLKMLAGIYSPTKGNIAVDGKLTPFIELGVGFNPELTGRENVFLNGALLGFNRKEMFGMYQEIVDFAELERFMDQKLKNYSSGMQVRLAFSIAIRAKGDILILDEVLAVGDEAFQKKCIDIFENYKAIKHTVVLVTHDMEIVKRFCSRAMLIDKGEIISIGDPNRVSSIYKKFNSEIISEDVSKKNDNRLKMNTAKVKLLTSSSISYGEEMRLNIQLDKIVGDVKNVGVAIYKNSGEYIFGTNTILDKFKLENVKNINYTLDAKLGNGNYHFKVGIFGRTDKEIIEFINDGPEFTVQSQDLNWEGTTFLTHKWDS